MLKRFTYLLVVFATLSCSQFSRSPTSKAWHNVNTKYNALYLSEENLSRGNFLIDSTKIEDYSNILPIIVPIDTFETAVASQQFEDIIKYSSLIAERHSNSRFLDRAYVLLGIARYYKGDFLNASEVFKYVNTNGTKIDQKHSALIWLMRTYLEMGDFRNADGVSKILLKEDLNQKNRAHYFETQATFHQRQGELPLSVVFLDEANKLLKKSTHKGRNLFIAGQMYDKLGQRIDARKNWLKVVKNKPNYELEFNTNIELLVSNSLMGSDVSFEKMLEDRKNKDLKDKIYFKKGEANIAKQQYNLAVSDFQKSANLSTNNTAKSAAYLKIADVSYTNLANYEQASLYYDSTLQNINIKSPNYEEIKQKSKSLADFIVYSKVLRVEDSLQNLAAMNPLALETMVEEMLKAQEVQEKKLNEEAALLAKKSEAKNAVAIDKDTWFMYNQAALTKSRATFLRTWGNRPLEDNWRRKEKEVGKISFAIQRGIVGVDDVVPEEDEEAILAKKKAAFEAQKQEILAKIPNSQQALAQSKRKQEEAYYQLGKIYKFQFKEPENSKKMFLTLLDKFPETIYEQEVLYFLSLMDANKSDNIYRSKLIQKHPFSSYARQLKRGNVEITASTESNAEKAYADLYATYKNGSDLKAALETSNKVLLDYTGTSIEDKIAMLRILLLAKINDLNAYRIALLDFQQSYPSSNLSPKASEMLAKLNK